jgi:hypothetical protein
LFFWNSKPSEKFCIQIFNNIYNQSKANNIFDIGIVRLLKAFFAHHHYAIINKNCMGARRRKHINIFTLLKHSSFDIPQRLSSNSLMIASVSALRWIH